jgi:hypothetical protein
MSSSAILQVDSIASANVARSVIPPEIFSLPAQTAREHHHKFRMASP